MTSLSEHQLLLALVAVATILVAGRGSAEIARRLRQPEVLGELMGGFLLGPSVLGGIFPSAYHALFLTGPVGLGLSFFSWIGAIMLLLIAGLEVDLAIMRSEMKPGGLAAAFAIISSLIAGPLFVLFALGRPVGVAGIFLGFVLSVTAVSVVAKVLIERDALRRSYAQVLLAAGVVSEVIVWLLIAVEASFRGGSPLLIGIRSTAFAVLFFLFMMTLGRRFTFWAMRRVADMTFIVNGSLSLVLILGFGAAAITQALGLHALLGAFVFGVLLSQAPRANLPLKESLQTLTVSLFAPIFFVLAGMRVDIFKLGNLSAIGTVLLLFAVATVAKAGLGTVGARLGGLPPWEAVLVGVGLNLKGGTDVIVAILGAELGLLPTRTYTLYAVVAILTVLVSQPVLSWLMRKVPPAPVEMARLNRETARRRAYLPSIERVLVPVMTELLPKQAAELVEFIASAKAEEGELFDITRLTIKDSNGFTPPHPPTEIARAGDHLESAGELQEVELTERRVQTDAGGAVQTIIETSRDYGLIALGACPPDGSTTLSLGELQDQIIDRSAADVLVMVARPEHALSKLERILVPVNGFEYSMAAGDIAAHLARATGAELVLYNAVHSGLDEIFWKSTDHRNLLEAGYRTLRELMFRIERLDIRCTERVDIADDAGAAIVQELQRQPYQLIVLGAVDRSFDNRLYLGSPIQTILTQSDIPAALLVSHESPGEIPAAT